MKNDDMKLINENGLPSYMRITPQEMETLLDSFWNIFKSIKESVKLLWSTLELNIKVLDATFKNNSDALQKAYSQYNEERKEYNEKMKKNLKGFTDIYGNVGAHILVAAVNPFLFFGFERMENIASGKSEDELKNNDHLKNKQKTSSDRVKKLLNFFGYYSINEAIKNNKKNLPKIDQNTIDRLNFLSQNYIANEKKNMDQVLKISGNYILVTKKISNAKNFDELIASFSDANKLGIKISSSEIKKISDDIKLNLEKQSKDDPKKFAETIAKLRKEYPQLKNQDDITAAMSVTFSIVKSKFQKKFIELYNQSVIDAKKTINPNLDEKSFNILLASPEGKEYVNLLNDFNNKLRSGQSQMSNLKTQTV